MSTIRRPRPPVSTSARPLVVGEPRFGRAALVADFHPRRLPVHRDRDLERAAVPRRAVLDGVGSDLADQEQHVIEPGKAVTEHACHELPGLPDR